MPTTKRRRVNAVEGGVTDMLHKAGFLAQKDGNSIKVKGEFQGLRALIDGGLDPKLKWSNIYNHSENQKNFTSTKNSFRGGSLESLENDLSGKMDISRHVLKLREMETSGILRRLRTQIGLAYPKRRRVFSEHDGDWDYDRRWDIMPFQATSRPPQVGRTLILNCDMCVNASTKSKALDKYGVLVWAISNIIESAGICTRILYTEFSTGATEDGSSSDIEVIIKNTGEYIAPPLLASVFQTNFFRRIGFSLLTLAAEAVGEEVAMGLGHAETKHRTLEYGDGVLYLHPDLAETAPAELENGLLAAMKGAV